LPRRAGFTVCMFVVSACHLQTSVFKQTPFTAVTNRGWDSGNRSRNRYAGKSTAFFLGGGTLLAKGRLRLSKGYFGPTPPAVLLFARILAGSSVPSGGPVSRLESWGTAHWSRRGQGGAANFFFLGSHWPIPSNKGFPRASKRGGHRWGPSKHFMESARARFPAPRSGDSAFIRTGCGTGRAHVSLCGKKGGEIAMFGMRDYRTTSHGRIEFFFEHGTTGVFVEPKRGKRWGTWGWDEKLLLDALLGKEGARNPAQRGRSGVPTGPLHAPGYGGGGEWGTGPIAVEYLFASDTRHSVETAAGRSDRMKFPWKRKQRKGRKQNEGGGGGGGTEFERHARCEGLGKWVGCGVRGG